MISRFGLKHTGYSPLRQVIVTPEIPIIGDLTTIVAKDISNEDSRIIHNVRVTGSTTYNYKYQGQERQDEFGLNWDSFKWRNYDVAIGRFFNVDPLAEQYTYNSPYAFSENRVIDARELEGLEKVLFQGALKNDRLFNRAYEALRSTEKGKEFSQNLKSQSKYNVLYAPYTKGMFSALTITNQNQKEFDENIDYFGLYIKKEDYNFLSDNGKKGILIIAIGHQTKKKRNDIDNKQAFELAGSLGHEETAHGNNILKGISKSVEEEHFDFQGTKSIYSPSKDEVLTKEEYKGTQARELFMEILKILKQKNE